MKQSIYLLYLLLLLALPTACLPAAPDAELAAPTTSASETGANPNAFPVTLEHKFGTTTIAAEPQRVLSLGYSDQDAILALGIQPIAVRHWFGEPQNGVWAWAQAALGDAVPQVLEMPLGELNLEKIAALQPDLIVAISAALSAEEYNLLAQIAPVVAIPQEYETMLPWQEQTRLVGLATGRSAQAEEVIAALEAQIAAVRAAHPEFEGKTVNVAEYLEAGSYYIFDPGNSRIRFLNSLGFVVPVATLELHAAGTANGVISGERLDLLEADLLIWEVATSAEQATLEALPLYQKLAVAGQNRDLFFTYTEEPNLISAALSYGTVLSIPSLLETLVPQLSAVLGGETAVTTAESHFPLTITDAAGQKFTFDAPPKIGCDWLGCHEILAELGVVPQASYFGGRPSQFLTPVGVPPYIIEDWMNPEAWVAAEVDLLIKRGPATPKDDALAAAVPIFRMHFSPGGTTAITGIAAYYENTRLLGQLTDKPDAAEAMIARFEAVQAKLRSLATDETRALRIAAIFADPAVYYALGHDNPFCTVLADAGLGQCMEAGWWEEVNAEAFLSYNPDWIIYMDQNWPALVDAEEATFTDRTDLIWSQLTAVKGGRVYKSATQRFDCCSTRMLTHALQDYVSHILPDVRIPAPGPLADFDPTQSPLVTGE